jgi:lysophospholipase L1-like esterase
MTHPISKSLILLTLLSFLPANTRADFPLKDNDIWVLAGDSITAQHLHSNYFEAYCFARYPNLKFAFRNSGVGGHTIPTTLARFDYDIAAWKPTIVSVELGMNDQGGTSTDKFIANMKTMVDRIRAINARPIILSSSPINNGSTIAAMGPKNRLNEYATSLKDFSAKENIPYSDQFHALADVWANNKPKESLANSLSALKLTAADDSTAGVEHLRAFLAAQEQSPTKPVSMQGDSVHPGPPGQLMMAAALLKGLDAPSLVSAATIDANTKLAQTQACKIDAIKSENNHLEFDRLDNCSPFPIPDDARAVLSLYPAILDLSQYTLKITGLKDGTYTLKINNIPAVTITAKELESGINLTALGPIAGAKEISPIIAQSRAILAAVNNKENLVSQWRNLSQKAHAPNAPAEAMQQLNALTPKVEEADQKIRDAAQPKPLHFDLTPAQ